MDLFKDVITSLLNGKERVINNDDDAKAYVPYIVNKAISKYKDCIFFAAEINMLASLSNKMQYDFYYDVLRKYKRPFIPWLKKDQVMKEELDFISEVYGCSFSKALEIRKILTVEQMNFLKNRGGPINT